MMWPWALSLRHHVEWISEVFLEAISKSEWGATYLDVEVIVNQ